MNDVDEMRQELLAGLEKSSDLFMRIRPQRSRPIIGGVFGRGRFEMRSTVNVVNGLDAICYTVTDAESGFVICNAYSQSAALDLARRVIAVIGQMPMQAAISRRIAGLKVIEMDRMRLEQEERDIAKRARPSARIRSIPRRRKQIFEASDGRCHYCSTLLSLDGKWHIEHKMPKALGGDNAPGNLVASCAPCNHEKRDTTEQEFRAKRASKVAA